MNTKIEKKQEQVTHLEAKNLECANRGTLQSGIEAAEFLSISKQLMKAKRELKNLLRAI